MPANLNDLLAAALDTRRTLLEQLTAEHTNAYRLFHGSVEGEPGLTVDRYGDALLVQTFHRPLASSQLTVIETFYSEAFPGLPVFYNDRSRVNSRISNALPPEQIAAAHESRRFHEMGISYCFRARHAGQDPWLFLDLRAGRRRVMRETAGKSLLNLFANTCGVGIAAAKSGARHVVNVDFSESCLTIGKENAHLNELPIRLRFVRSDIFPALRQFSGQGQAQIVRGKRMPSFPKLEPHQFDVVFFDPPRFAQSPFGVVDLVNDYAALFKPALLCAAEGGTLICCNNVPEVSNEIWIDLLLRSARKAGRGIHDVEWIAPEGDFPSSDGRAPLKMVLLRV
jgi:23S rRNA (cytosine1962-C5)-methyltransferase